MLYYFGDRTIPFSKRKCLHNTFLGACQLITMKYWREMRILNMERKTAIARLKAINCVSGT